MNPSKLSNTSSSSRFAPLFKSIADIQPYEIVGDRAHPRIEWASLHNALQPDGR